MVTNTITANSITLPSVIANYPQTTATISYPHNDLVWTFKNGSNIKTNNDLYFVKDGDTFSKIEVLCPNKVIRFTFQDNTVIKTVCDEADQFDFEFAFFIALAKKINGKELTPEGIVARAKEYSYTKRYIKLVKNGIKLYYNQLKEEEKKKQEEKERKEIKIRQAKKKAAKKAKVRKARAMEMAEVIKNNMLS